VVAYADLGGLGSKQGAPVFYDWKPPSLGPLVLPWVAVLALLMLKPNRCASAWWIWVPLACVGGVTWAPEGVVELLPSGQAEILLELIGAAGFGLAAVWLLSSYVAWKHRVVAAIGILGAQGVFSVLAAAMRLGVTGFDAETFLLGMGVVASVVVMSLGLALAGLACRGRYGWLRLSLWLMAMLGGLWLLVMGPFFVLAMLASGQGAGVLALFPIVLSVTGLTFGVMLPFLVLSFANGFYRERLMGLLHLGCAAPPPIIPLAVAVTEV